MQTRSMLCSHSHQVRTPPMLYRLCMKPSPNRRYYIHGRTGSDLITVLVKFPKVQKDRTLACYTIFASSRKTRNKASCTPPLDAAI
eukprot:scaffold1695_cov167-Amphora_coffeaeformis.AAC.22